MKLTVLSFAIAYCCVLSVAGVQRPRGVSLEKASLYQAGQEFHCLSDGKPLPIDHVNDDYCDCDDGSDEPGTSACPNGLFYCENQPYKGAYVRSSRVNDGICDCCDGSDEYSGIISCPNTCMERYKQARAQQEVLRRNQAEGYKVKQEYMQQGKRAKDEKLSKLSELEKEKEVLISEKEAAEAEKNTAEEPEKAAKEEHKKVWEAVKEERQKVKDAASASLAFGTLDANTDGKVDYPELMKHKEFDIDSDGTVSEEEAKEYLEENEEVDVALFTEKIWPNIKEIYKLEEEAPADSTDPKGDDLPSPPDSDEGVIKDDTPPEIMDDVVEGGSPEEGYNDDDDEEDEDDDDEDSAYDISDNNLKEGPLKTILDDNALELEGKTPEEISKILKERGELVKNLNETVNMTSGNEEEEKEPEYDEETKRLIAVADDARIKFDDADRKLRDHESEISDIKRYLELDFGPNEEFSGMKGQCFEYTDREYTYRLCPFDKSSQKNKNGGIETSLGTWGKWHGPEDDKYSSMKYENGQGCWNGPSRSTHVNLHCGPTNEVTSATEPSRCEYQFEFTTPAKCDPPKAVELNDVHDEL